MSSSGERGDAGPACAGGGGGLTGQWGSGRTWSCRGRWAGGRSSSRPRPPPPSSHLLGFPGPRCHLKGHRAATSGRSTRQAPVTWASPRQQILTQLRPTAQCTRPGKGAWLRARAHARSRLGEPWPGVSRPPRAGPSAETPSSPCASPSHTRHPGHRHLCPTGSCLLECSRNTRPLGPETGAAGLPSPGSGLTPQEKTRASAGPQTRS